MLKEAYVTVEEADEINFSVEWLDLVYDEKETALKWGRVYIDGRFTCPSILNTDIRYSDFTNALKTANARLGDYYVQGKLFQSSDTNDSVLTAKSVKAGTVSISKKFADSNTTIGSTKDLFPEVSLLLAPYCSTFGSSFKRQHVIRS